MHARRRLTLYIALGVSLLIILFPPFIVNAMGVTQHEYGFIFSGPPSVEQMQQAAKALGGPQGQQMTAGMMQWSVDILRITIEFVVVWGLYAALITTVLKRPTMTEPAS